MYFYEQEMEEVFAVCMAGTAIVLLSSIQAELTAFLAILCTPKKLLPIEEPLEQNRLKSQKKKK